MLRNQTRHVNTLGNLGHATQLKSGSSLDPIQQRYLSVEDNIWRSSCSRPDVESPYHLRAAEKCLKISK